MNFSTYKKYMSAFKFNSKSKAIPLQAWTGLDGSKKLRTPDFKTIVT